jgi:hypothetical protein
VSKIILFSSLKYNSQHKREEIFASVLQDTNKYIEMIEIAKIDYIPV